MQSWKASNSGIEWITLLIEDPNNVKPPTTNGAKVWRDNFGLNSVYVAPDPGYPSMLPAGGGSFGTPMHAIIDPRTMKVIKAYQGYTNNYSPLTGLASQNK